MWCVAFMTILFLVMMTIGRSADTKELAFVPLAIAMVELCVSRVLTPEIYPVITGILMLLRVTVVLCCIGALCKERRCAKKRAHQLHKKAKAVSLAKCA